LKAHFSNFSNAHVLITVMLFVCALTFKMFNCGKVKNAEKQKKTNNIG